MNNQRRKSGVLIMILSVLGIAFGIWGFSSGLMDRLGDRYLLMFVAPIVLGVIGFFFGIFRIVAGSLQKSSSDLKSESP